MTRQALEDAYIAGFNDGRDSVGKVADDDAATHCLLGFDGWWSNALGTLNRAPSSVPDDDGWIAWDGSLDYPPVANETTVEVRFGSGNVSRRRGQAVEWGWRWSMKTPQAFDIIAYRVVKP